MKISIVVAIVLATVACAQARIGETKAQCTARYGDPVGVSSSGVSYCKSGIMVMCHFYSNVCDRLVICRFNEDGMHLREAISSHEIELLLAANGAGAEWKSVTGGPVDLDVYRTTDGNLQAQYSRISYSLTIYTRAALARNHAMIRATETQRLDGF